MPVKYRESISLAHYRRSRAYELLDEVVENTPLEFCKKPDEAPDQKLALAVCLDDLRDYNFSTCHTTCQKNYQSLGKERIAKRIADVHAYLKLKNPPRGLVIQFPGYSQAKPL